MPGDFDVVLGGDASPATAAIVDFQETLRKARLEAQRQLDQIDRTAQAKYKAIGGATSAWRSAQLQANQALRTGARETNRLATEQARLSTGLSTSASRARLLVAGLAGLSGIQVFRGAVGTIVDFEASMSNLAAVTQGTDEQMEALEHTARNLGAVTRFSATEAASGMEFLARAGFKTDQIIAAIPGTLDLAAAGALDLGRAADIVSNILSAFNEDASEAGRVADILAASAASANTNVEQMGEAMKTVAPIASTAGRSIEETAAAIGVLSNAGIQASDAGTQLRGVLLALANPSSEAEKRLSEMHVTLGELDPSTHTIIELFERLEKAQLNLSDAGEIFGRRNAAAALVLTRAMPILRDLTAGLITAEGAAARMAAIMDDNVRGAARQLLSALSELTLQAGDAGLTGAMRDALDTMTEAVRVLAGLGTGFEDASTSAQLLTTAMELGVAALAGLAGARAVRMLQTMVLWTRRWVLQQVALNTAMARNPVGLIATALGLAITAAVGWNSELAKMITGSDNHERAVNRMNIVLEKHRAALGLAADEAHRLAGETQDAADAARSAALAITEKVEAEIKEALALLRARQSDLERTLEEMERAPVAPLMAPSGATGDELREQVRKHAEDREAEMQAVRNEIRAVRLTRVELIDEMNALRLYLAEDAFGAFGDLPVPPRPLSVDIVKPGTDDGGGRPPSATKREENIATLRRELAVQRELTTARESGEGAFERLNELRAAEAEATRMEVLEGDALRESVVQMILEKNRLADVSDTLGERHKAEAAAIDDLGASYEGALTAFREAGRERAKAEREAGVEVERFIKGLETANELELLGNLEREKALAIIEAQNLLLDDQGRILRDLGPLERARIEAAVETRIVRAEQLKDLEELGRAVDRVGQRMIDRFVDATGKVEFSWREMVDSILEELQRLALSEVWQQLLYGPDGGVGGGNGIISWISGGIGSLFGGGGGGGFTSGGGFVGGSLGSIGLAPFHSGRGPGDTVRYRFYPSEPSFATPRLHSGAGPGELQAIIRQDEGVFTSGQMRALGLMAKGGRGNVEVHNYAPGTQARAEEGDDGTLRVIIDAVENHLTGALQRRSGNFNRAMRSTFQVQS